MKLVSANPHLVVGIKMKRALAEDAGLPEELYLENILTRLPAKVLAICSCVCKLWRKTISKDSRFASSHYIQNQTNSHLAINLLNVRNRNIGFINYFFKLEKDDEFLSYINFMEFGYGYYSTQEVVGYSNGLTCLIEESQSPQSKGTISIVNPSRAESLTLCYATPKYIDLCGSVLCRYLCYGFGFDSLSQTYKVVILFATRYSYKFKKFYSTISKSKVDHQEIVCMVLTLGQLGTNSWRSILANTPQVSAAPGSSLFPNPMLTREGPAIDYRNIDQSGTLCGGDFFWRMTYGSATRRNDVEMLLSFDIHNEKIQLIPFPPECNPKPPSSRNERQHLVVDHHLLEFKGCLCVARSETINCHRLTNRNSSDSCRCSVKVHLYILKDKVNQEWNEGEIFDVQIKEEGLGPFCRDFGTTTNESPPLIRMLSFSDQLLLYWFHDKCLISYNLHKKHLKVVKCRGEVDNIFENKKKHELLDQNPRPRDYQLHAQVENLLSLKTFLPEGETTKFYSWNEFQETTQRGNRNPFAGWMNTARESVKVCCFKF